MRHRIRLVMSRTYSGSAAGTFGQAIPGYPAQAAIQPGGSGQLMFLRQGSRFRTNVGFVNTEASTVTVFADFYDASGSLLGTRTYTLRPYEYAQRSNIFTEVSASEVPLGSIVVRPLGGGIFASASIIDNATGDPIFVNAEE